MYTQDFQTIIHRPTLRCLYIRILGYHIQTNPQMSIHKNIRLSYIDQPSYVYTQEYQIIINRPTLRCLYSRILDYHIQTNHHMHPPLGVYISDYYIQTNRQISPPYTNLQDLILHCFLIQNIFNESNLYNLKSYFFLNAIS